MTPRVTATTYLLLISLIAMAAVVSAASSNGEDDRYANSGNYSSFLVYQASNVAH